MFSVAFFAPSAPVARKRTVIVHVALTARVVFAQVFVPVNVKLFAFGPVIVTAPMATGSSPLLVTVIVRVTPAPPSSSELLPKATGDGVAAIAGAGARPVPLSVTFCVLPTVLPESSVTRRVAVRAPVPAGENVTPIVQLAPAARVPATAGQVPPERAKSPGLVPTN